MGHHRGGQSMLLTLFGVRVVPVLFLLLVPFALTLLKRVTRTALFHFGMFFLFDHEDFAWLRYGIMRACQRQYASPSSMCRSRLK